MGELGMKRKTVLIRPPGSWLARGLCAWLTATAIACDSCSRRPPPRPARVVAATGGAGRLEILDLNNPAADRTALKFNDTGFAFHVLSTTSGPFIVEAPGTGMYGGQLLSLNTTTGETTPVLDEVPKATDWASVGNRVYAVCPDGLLCYNAEEHSVTRFPIPGIDPEGGLGCTDAGIVIHLVSGPLAIVQPLDGS